MEFDLENPIIAGADDHSDLFAAESDHSTSFNGSPSSVPRQNAISLLVQVRFACGLDPFLIYLAANYIDRFLSRREIPSEKPWIVRLLCICCLSLAAKMMKKKEKTDFSLANLQEDGFIFDSRTIKRMELLVLGALDWRMRSVTPLAFVEFFAAFFSVNQKPFLDALKNRTIETLLKAQTEIKTLEFKPSEIAASAVLSASNELFPVQFPALRSAISSCEFVNEEKLMECYGLMSDVVMMDGSDSCNTPVTVLDPICSISGGDRAVGLGSDGRKRRGHAWD